MNFKFVKWALGVLGFSAMTSSCEKIDDIIGDDMVCMYGCPSADYVFNIEVEDKDSGDKLEGVRVSTLRRYEVTDWGTEGNPTTTQVDTLARGITDKDGKLVLSYNVFPVESLEVVADDIDGQENGDYASAAVVMKINNDDYKNPGEYGWYKGTATKDVTIKLQKK
jgi:putative lipoprotein (rSAM/lipoprotein system)